MASRFWVGGTGTWDGSSTAHWSATTGGGSGASVPGSADTVTFNAASGGGTVTVNTTVTVQTITCGAFTGTLDFSANNNNVTLNTGGFSGTGTGTRTINLGNGTWTISANSGATLWDMGVTTNLTFNANSSTITFTGNPTATGRGFIGGGLTYNVLSLSANSGGGGTVITGANTFATFSVAAPHSVYFPTGTNTFTNAPTLTGTSSTPILFSNNSGGSGAATLSIAGAATATWAAFRALTLAGGGSFTATNSLDLGANTGFSITPPSAGGGSSMLVHPGMQGGARG